jgi:hypothetical protein
MDWILDGALVAIFIAGVVFIVMRVVSWYLQRD